MLRFSLLSTIILWSLPIYAGGYIIKGGVIGDSNGESLGFAAVSLLDNNGTHRDALCDAAGKFHFDNISAGTYRITVSYIGYDKYEKTISVNSDLSLKVQMKMSANSLNEVVVTAFEANKGASLTKIDSKAMEHLQPSSFTDLLELLPGGKSENPNMGAVNLIKLREVSSPGYSISSLGVGFMVDGIPLNIDADMQKVPSGAHTDRESASKGVDMRTISTDNIESVEIIRGVPSVEYGNITGGVVNITRKNSVSPLAFRFKADHVGKLFSVGRGFAVFGGTIFNADISYFDSKVDVRDPRENYKRLTVSSRLTHNATTAIGHLDFGLNVDYTGSFDNVKRDKDVTIKEDRYKSTYNKYSLGISLALKPQFKFVKELKLYSSVSYQLDRIEEVKSVSIDRPTGMPTSLVEGEHDGEYLPYTYLANMIVDGKPFYANLKLQSKFTLPTGDLTNSLLVGAEWNMNKNYGDGTVYDMSRPLNTGSTARPRRFFDIPSRHDLSLYSSLNLKWNGIDVDAGVRSSAIYGIGSQYAINGHYYFDPRINVGWSKEFTVDNNTLKLNVSAGVGWMTRMPTIDQLFPNDIYIDLVQLNYYHTNPDYRRLNLRTYILDNANYDLRPSRNRKWEISMGASYRAFDFRITYFQEAMNNAFGTSTYFRTFEYKKYDATSAGIGRPQLEDLTFENDTIIDVFSQTGNSTNVRKQGIEFVLSTMRFNSIKTRFTLNGAWIKTIYSTSTPQYRESSILLNGKQLQYVGLYDWEDGMQRSSLSTNLIADTYLDNVGMIFSIAAQCTWYSEYRNLWNSGMPVYYIDNSGAVHPFTAESAQDMQLQHLVSKYTDSYFAVNTTPFAAYINLKATKEMGRHIKVSLFVNRILSILPDYYNGSQLVRRTSSPYFGMEANLRF